LLNAGFTSLSTSGFPPAAPEPLHHIVWPVHTIPALCSKTINGYSSPSWLIC
jgi:hypothetical protein